MSGIGNSRIVLTIAFCALVFIGITLAAPPIWWADKEVLIPDAPAADYTAVNMGQVKSIAAKAVAEMNERLPGGAGPGLNDLVASWSDPPAAGVTRYDYAAVNQGQLKSVAKLFYDRLAEVGYEGPPLVSGEVYPWTADTSDDNSFAAANIGQVKYLFSFDPSLVNLVIDPDPDPDENDGDSDGFPDSWELRYFGNLTTEAATDNDGDGLTNLQEFQTGNDPSDFYNGIAPRIASLINGSGVSVSFQSYTGAPTVATPVTSSSGGNQISMVLRNAAGLPLANAPLMVSFHGTGGAANAAAGPYLRQLSVRTNGLGVAQIYVSAGARGSLTVNPEGSTIADDADTRYATIDLGKGLEPLGIATDGTITLRGLNANGTTKILRWHEGMVTKLVVPVSIYAYPHNRVEPLTNFYPERVQVDSYGYHIRNAITSSGLVLSAAEDSGGSAALYYSASEEFMVAWVPNNESPVILKAPVTRSSRIVEESETQIIYNTDRSTFRLYKICGNDELWASPDRSLLRPSSGLNQLHFGPYDSVGLAALGDINLTPRGVIDVNAQRQVIGWVAGFGNPYYFVGTYARPVDFVPIAINDQGLILGDDPGPGGGLGAGYPKPFHNPGVYAPNIIQQADGVRLFKPMVFGDGLKTYLPGVEDNPSARIVGLDETGNVFGSINPTYTFTGSLISSGQNVIWVAKPTEWGLPEGTPAYTAIAWAHPRLGGDWLPDDVTLTASGIYPRDPEIHLGVAAKLDDTQGNKSLHGFAQIPAALVVDANRDNHIRTSSEDEPDYVSASEPFRFWINDDDDRGPAEGNDIPEQDPNKADYNNATVDSVRDLVDFFPVYLDIKQLLTMLPHTGDGITYKLKQADGALNFVYTNKTKEEALDYHKQLLSTGFGPYFIQAAGVATVQQITAEGVTLDSAFLTGTRDNGWGVVLVEGRSTTYEPLVLSVEKDGATIATVSLPLNISEVEVMFRHVDLTDVPRTYSGGTPELPKPTVPSRIESPPNWPDSQTSDKYFVFVHGYNVDAQKARGWQAEIFKRLHAMGSKARFVGLTWHGATGLDYHQAVYFGFQTGDAVADALSFTGNADVTIAAHSLGNMVASHAIQSGGFTPSRFYMINAAVPIEAYSLDDVGEDDAEMMTESTWRAYDERLYAANWHLLFSESDSRVELTWKREFESIRSAPEFAYNFYSTEEDVVADANDASSASIIGTILRQGFDLSQGAWKAQELAKGVDWTGSLASLFMDRGQAGWKFRFNRDISGNATDGPPYQLPEPSETASISNVELRTKPFFNPFLESALLHSDSAIASTKAAESKVKYDLLARAIPAMSNAAAANDMPSLSDDRNFDMPAQGNANGDLPTPSGRWRHSDFKNVALPYVYPMYNKMINLEGEN